MPNDDEDDYRIEQHFRHEDRKITKRERKIATAKDRSKYKHTDQKMVAKAAPPPDAENLLRGRVLSIMSQGIIVQQGSETFTCILRGILKKEKGHQKNLVVVGDYVLFEKTHPGEGVIAYVEPRRTILSRADNLSRHKEQLIAANIDQVLITASVVHPFIKPSIIDRYIIATQKGGMQPLVIVNKIDLLKNESFPEVERESEAEILELFLEAYRQAKIPVICVSAETGAGLDELRAHMKDKASVFAGQSGVGKSSLINAVANYNLKVGEVVEKTSKGSHTTTMAKLMPLDFGGWCIDTPGIKSFGLWQLKREDIESYFPEINELSTGCKFPDCRHLHEKECAVLKALESGEISPLRYDSYQFLIESLSQEHLPR